MTSQINPVSIEQLPPMPLGQMPPMPWGFHGIFDCVNCSLDKMQDKDNIQAWITELTAALALLPIDSLLIIFNGLADNNTSGFVVFQPLSNGSISVHMSDNNRELYVDLFSYSEYQPGIVDTSLLKYFGDVTIRKVLMPRNAAVGG